MSNKRIKDLEIAGEVDFLRQKDFFDPTKEDNALTVIGSGGIGSFFTVLASKMGISEIVLYDNDTFEAHNIPNQFAHKGQLGMPKVEAIKDTAEAFGIAEVYPIEDKVSKYTSFRTPWVVSGVDSMKARKEIWEAIKNDVAESEYPPKRYWDARLGGEMVTVWSVDLDNPEEMEAFEDTLYDDDEAVDLPCTRRAVIDVMGYVGSFLATELRHAIAGEYVPGYLFFNAESMFCESSGLIEAVEFERSTRLVTV